MDGAPIALLTDFGPSEYVGVVKGVLAGLAPRVPVIDLTHAVLPQNVRQGAWLLAACAPSFPAGTVFCAVVDPGVGSERAALVVRGRRYVFVGPDNGLLYPAADGDAPFRVFRLPVPTGAAPTFHARDVFAPAAARLALGEAPEAIGVEVGEMVPLRFHRDGREGEVVHVDAFGNIITNLPPVGRHRYRVRLNGQDRELVWVRTYAEGQAGEPCLVTGSHGCLEIAVPGGSAAARFGVVPGQRVTIT